MRKIDYVLLVDAPGTARNLRVRVLDGTRKVIETGKLFDLCVRAGVEFPAIMLAEVVDWLFHGGFEEKSVAMLGALVSPVAMLALFMAPKHGDADWCFSR